MKKNLSELNELNPKYILLSRRPLLVTVGIGVVCVVVIFGGIIPQLRASFTAWKSWRTELVARDQLQKKVAQLQQVSTDATAEQASLVNSVLPSKKPLLELLNGISQVAGQSGVSITTVELSPGSIATEGAGTAEAKPKATTKTTETGKKAVAVSKKEFETLDVQLSVLGSLANINTFFDKVEQLAPATTITSISLEKSRKTTIATTPQPDGAPTEDQYLAKVEVETYYFTKSISATLDAPLPAIGNEEAKLLELFATYIQGQATQQTIIQGGGLNDLFGENKLELLGSDGSF